jgi:hypothetical protein
VGGGVMVACFLVSLAGMRTMSFVVISVGAVVVFFAAAFSCFVPAVYFAAASSRFVEVLVEAVPVVCFAAALLRFVGKLEILD